MFGSIKSAAKMLALDMDGTILLPDGTISAYTLDVLAKCRAKGLHIAPATGRAYKNCLYRGYLRDLGAYGGVYSDGAHVVAGDEDVFVKHIPFDTAKGVLAALAASPFCSNAVADSPDGYYVQNREAAGSFAYPPTFSLRAFGASPRDAYAIAAVLDTDEHSAAALAADIQAAFPDVCMSYIGGDLLLIPPAGVTKMTGLAHLAKHAGIKPKNIIAFGDSLNDLAMLAGVPNSVAPANARQEVKVAAKHICGPAEEDGVAKWIEQNLL